MTWHTIKHEDCAFTMLKNNCTVEALTHLHVYKEATDAVALASAEVVEYDNDDHANPPPAKKPKRKVRCKRRHGRKRDELAASSDAMAFRRSCIDTLRRLMPWLCPDRVARALFIS